MYSALHQVFIKVHVLLTTLNSQLTPGNVRSQNENNEA